jgi:hypothetical protein
LILGDDLLLVTREFSCERASGRTVSLGPTHTAQAAVTSDMISAGVHALDVLVCHFCASFNYT